MPNKSKVMNDEQEIMSIEAVMACEICLLEETRNRDTPSRLEIRGDVPPRSQHDSVLMQKAIVRLYILSYTNTTSNVSS
jgi:hypothetical protein